MGGEVFVGWMLEARARGLLLLPVRGGGAGATRVDRGVLRFDPGLPADELSALARAAMRDHDGFPRPTKIVER